MDARSTWRALGLLALVLALLPVRSMAQETLCATVKIEIVQEFTLERQAFDARMRIDNGLDTLDLLDVNVDVLFSDEDGNPVLASSDPDDSTASFFITVDSMDGIGDVSGNGTVGAASDAEIHWLIIPVPGAAQGQLQGKLYQVGARLSYTLGGEEQVIEVVPDTITVKPQPVLALDYFLQQEVYADDAFTPQIEAAEPFTLGVRIKNQGSGTARNVKIDSAQPRIVENELGLLIGFEITGSFVNDEEAQESLLIDFGDIEPNGSTVGRWLMETTLSGEFTEFSAEFTHADELGGALTSQIDGVDAHLLVHDVRVDLQGRDAVRDFLADDGSVLRVYESDGVDTLVDDLSASASLVSAGGSGAEPKYAFTVAPTAGMLFVKLPDPLNGVKEVLRVVRSDGKVLPARNGWTSKTRNGTTFDHYLNVFDANGGGTYTITLTDPVSGPLPPTLQFVADRSGLEGDTISFIVEASDPNGTIPALTVDQLPVGASFFDGGAGLGTFTWATTTGQAGSYPLFFRASDGILLDSQVATVQVIAANDSDADGLDDDWEIDNFGNLGRDGTGDADGDGVSDLDEFLNGTDPNSPPEGPTPPIIVAPLWNDVVTDGQPDLVVENGSWPGGPVTYAFEIYADEGMTDLVTRSPQVAEGVGQTAWPSDVALPENGGYLWRARAETPEISSDWVVGRFSVDAGNDVPGPFYPSWPGDGTSVLDASPTLEVTNSVDPDGEALLYEFEVYGDAGATELLADSGDVVASASGTTVWVVDPPLSGPGPFFWRAFATDPLGASAATAIASFSVDPANAPPSAPTPVLPLEGGTVATADLDLVVANASDPESAGLSYFFDLDEQPTFDSPALIQLGPIAEGAIETSVAVLGLSEDRTYHWRAKASDGAADSPWAGSTFTVDSGNDPPSVPTSYNPGHESWSQLLQPKLAVNPSLDPEGDPVQYDFELYHDSGLTELITSVTDTDAVWPVDVVLDSSRYYWRARSRDDQGAMSAWSLVNKLHTRDDQDADPPWMRFDRPTPVAFTSEDQIELRWVDADPDSNATITLLVDGSPITTLEEDPDGVGDGYAWDLSGLADGTYQVTGVIDDGTTSQEYVCCSVTISDAVRVADVEINEGRDERSGLESIAITFDGPTNLGDLVAAEAIEAAVQLWRREPSGPDTQILVPSAQYHWDFVTNTLTVDLTGLGLSSGNYEIRLATDQVLGAPGQPLTETDGVADGVQRIGGREEDGFFQLTGDVNGDRIVNFLDLRAVEQAFLTSEGEPGYNADADIVRDGVINFLDMRALREEWMTSIDF